MDDVRRTLCYIVAAALVLIASPAAAETGDAAETEKTDGAKPAATDSDEPATETSDDSAESEASDPTDTTVRTTSRAPIPKFTASRSTNVVDEEEIKRKQAQSITDALDEEPGNFVQSTNRGAGSVFLRGLVGPANLIYFDGVRFNQSTFRTGPNQYLNTVDPWALDRIEVVRGPGSVLYGSGAMGGVIQLFPRDLPDDDVELRGIAMTETADRTAGTALDVGGEAGPVTWSAGGSFRSHEDLRIGQWRNDELVAPGENDRGQVPGSSFEETHFRTAARLDISDRSAVRVNYYGGSIDNATRVDRLGEGEVRLYDNRDDLLYATYEYDGVEIVDELNWNVSYHRTDERVDRFNCETEGFGGDDIQVATDPRGCAAREDQLLETHRINEDTVHTVGTSLSASNYLLDRKLRVSAGLDVYGDTVRSSRRDAEAPAFIFTERDRGNFSDGSTYTRAGLYTHGEYRLVRSNDHDLYVSGGARVARFGAHAPDVHDELGDVSYDFAGVIGSAGLKYLYGTKLNAYLTWDQGFRAPNLQESTVLGNTGNFFEIPNDNLGPERNNSLELGTKLDFPDVGKLSAAAWVSLIDEKITREEARWNGESEVDGTPVRRRINADTAYYSGADLSVETTDVAGFSLFGSLSLIDGAVESDSPSDNFEPGPLHGLLAGDGDYANPRRLPPTMYRFGVDFASTDDFYIRMFLLGASAQTKLGPGDVDDLRICEADPGVLASDTGDDCAGTGGWTTLNLRGGYTPWEFARLDLAVENMTDLRFKYHGSGPPAPGINGKLLLTVKTP